MQDRYSGDVGDFGKYILLNQLYANSKEKITIGFNWYKVTQEEKNNDGKYTNYLSPSNRQYHHYYRCSPEIHTKLKSIVDSDNRCLEAIENNNVLPPNTLFYSNEIPLCENYVNRKSKRKHWFDQSLSSLNEADVVYVDPDNGIQTKSVKKTHKDSIKYVFKDEIQKYYLEGKSVIIYNHRNMAPEEVYLNKFRELANLFSEEADLRVLKFSRYSVRDYVFLIQQKHKHIINKTIDQLIQKPFNFMFNERDL
ncbi:hypothetical protein [Methanococcoides alaskense]|uniref:Uncharacterized protein n=1 Tax=Methanococcoides alaskense TaxID=325778 RepID=A0AA90ZAN7_9EURY|nr:hypothetical protein [Methanococcoides alaskense]MDA0525450.1 hypothetical protein [Methanococcoides alaskense]MDR6221617.1 hypothetical protein [Methanococcoides alaskense]